jgi:hypothetical protein
MATQTFSQIDRAWEVMLSGEISPQSVKQITIPSGAGAIGAGAVLGMQTRRQAAAAVPGAPNTTGGTGTGAMTNLTFGPDVQVGAYLITLTATAATAAFSVVAPDGSILPNGAVGTAYKSSHLSFLVSNGGTMTLGDRYTVTVTAAGTPVVVGGTGNGVISAITLGKRAQLGAYTVINRAVVANGGDFEVLAPDGTSIGRFLMGTASTGTASFVSDHVNFTLSDDTDYILGNYFRIIVAGYTSPTANWWDPTAVDGTQIAAGILLAPVDATSAAQLATMAYRDMTAYQNLLRWKSTVTSGQKAEAYRQLSMLEIETRPTATAASGVMV